MASVLETRSDRLVVLMSPSEKKRLVAQARQADMSISDFVRAATEEFAGEPQLSDELLRELATQVKEAAARARGALDALEQSAAQADAFDETAFREKVRRELAAATGRK